MDVLVVDDAAIPRKMNSKAVRRVDRNSTISIAKNAQEALEKISEKNFDLVITDYHMGPRDKNNGTYLIQSMLRDGVESKIILVSSFDQEQFLPYFQKQYPGSGFEGDHYIDQGNVLFSYCQKKEEVTTGLESMIQEMFPYTKEIDRSRSNSQVSDSSVIFDINSDNKSSDSSSIASETSGPQHNIMPESTVSEIMNRKDSDDSQNHDGSHPGKVVKEPSCCGSILSSIVAFCSK